MVSHQALSRLVSHALRHEPWRYGVELAEAGWVLVDELLDAIHRQGPRFAHISRADLLEMMVSATKRRFEIDGDRIRALYGHSLPGRIRKAEAQPPPVLYHGTAPAALAAIRSQGLRPMGRQYVHLSADPATAAQVGRRKSPTPVVLRVRAAEASRAGIRFWRGNETVWLTDAVPASFFGFQSPR